MNNFDTKIEPKNFDIKYLYLNLLQRYFNEGLYLDLEDKIDRLINILLILGDSPSFIEIRELINTGIEDEDSEEESIFRQFHSRQDSSFSKIKKKFKKNTHLIKDTREILFNTLENLEMTWKDSELNRRSNDLKKLMGISELDLQSIFALIILKRIGKNFKSLPVFEGEYLESSRHERVFDRKNILKFLGDDPFKNGAILKYGSKIVTSGLIVESHFDKICISEDLYNYFCNDEATLESLHKLETKEGGFFDLDTFSANVEQVSLSKKLIESDRPTIIILTGEPGTGKTELARSLANETGRKALFVPVSKPCNRGDGLSTRRIALSVASQVSNLKDEVIIIDEADELLISKFDWRFMNKNNEGNKEFLNELLDRNKAKLIFICNHNLADSSTLRRASLVINFDKLCKKQRLVMIKNTIDAAEVENFLSNEEILYLERIDVSQGILALALEDAKAISDDLHVQRDSFLGLIQSRVLFQDGKISRKLGLT